MAARSGMASLILELRGFTDTKEQDVEVNGVAYWTDEQLQNVLDLYRKDVLDAELVSVPLMVNGVTEWTRYYIPLAIGHYLETDATPGAFSIVDVVGAAAPSHTVDIRAMTVVFNANTNGLEYFLRGRTYDVRAAAAHVWFMKAGHRAELIEWKAGGHTLSEDQEYQHCLEMYRLYSSFRGIGVTRLVRRGYSAQVNRGLWHG